MNQEIKDKVNACIDVVRMAYGLMLESGDLHIILEDNNVDDENLKFCSELAAKNPDRLYRMVGVLCCEKLSAFTPEEREEILARAITVSYL